MDSKVFLNKDSLYTNGISNDTVHILCLSQFLSTSPDYLLIHAYNLFVTNIYYIIHTTLSNRKRTFFPMIRLKIYRNNFSYFLYIKGKNVFNLTLTLPSLLVWLTVCGRFLRCYPKVIILVENRWSNLTEGEVGWGYFFRLMLIS